jgi:hypothetical protein
MPSPHEYDPAVAVAILFERLGHVMEKVDAMSAKIDSQELHRQQALSDLESRVAEIEQQITSVRWFLAGIAAAGGAAGGAVAAGIAKMIGVGL